MKRKKSFASFAMTMLISAGIGLCNGFFGGGGGMICVPLLEKYYKINNKKAHATTIAIILPLSIVSSIIYCLKNSFNYINLLYVTIGVTIGGVVGAMMFKNINGKAIRIIFALIMLFAGIRMLV